MITVYLLAPGVRVEVSRDGSDFKTHALRQQLKFPGTAETTDTQMVFVEGNRRVRVDRSDVIISRYNGQGGWKQFGA